MFRSIISDFDPRYWSRSAIAVLLASSTASAIGTGWLVVELVSRISWFLMQWILSWLFPPGITLALLPMPPVAFVLQDAAHDRAISETVVDLDLGDPRDDPYVDMGDAMIEDLDVAVPPPPSERLDMQIARNAGILGELESSSGLLAVLGTTGQSDGVMANLWGDSDALGDIDEAMSGVGGLIGAKGVQFGSGGLGSRGSGLGGGGTAEGLGGLGTVGVGGGGSSYGTVGDSPSTRRSASVKPGSSTTDGGLDPDVIRRVIRRKLSAIRYCYERELTKDPELAGKLVVRFEIAPSGTVSTAEVSSNAVGSGAVGSCITGQIKRLRFPKSDRPSTVSYPFVFSAG